MESVPDKAYDNVYSSAKKILQKRQRHLYSNMLHSLTMACKSANAGEVKVLTDDLIHFWFGGILPLVFDEDRAVQSRAIGAIEKVLPTIDVPKIRSSSFWPQLKSTMVGSYASQTHKLREERSHQWHRVWCLLLRILDVEIFKDLKAIETLLSIVSQGFQSANCILREEAFGCWRLLIQVFHSHDKLSSPDGLQLLCAPLKLLQRKSIFAVSTKFRVWWYLITCLDQKVEECFSTVMKPFLTFSFGASEHGILGAAQQYYPVCVMALPCLIAILGVESNEFLEKLFRNYKLEPLRQPSPFISPSVLSVHWRPIVNAAMEALRILTSSDETLSDRDNKLLQMLMRFLLNAALQIEIGPLFRYLCEGLAKMLPSCTRPVIIGLNIIATERLQLNCSLKNIDSYSDAMIALMKLILSATTVVPPEILLFCIGKIFTFEAFPNELMQSDAPMAVINLVTSVRAEENYEVFATKMLIWGRLSNMILKCFHEKGINFKLTKTSELNNWIVWPVQVCAAFAMRPINGSINISYHICGTWKRLLNLGDYLVEYGALLSQINLALKEILASRRESVLFSELFDSYANAVLRFDIDGDNTPQQDFCDLIEDALSQPLPKKSMDACLNTLRNLIVNLKHNHISRISEFLATVAACVVRNTVNGNIEAKFFENWKRALLIKLRTGPNSELSAQMNELLNGNDIFVAISSVWNPNPENLTERQRERFAKKAEIPAMSNDMSQSQDTSIKPWSQQISIVKRDQTALQGSCDQGNNNNMENRSSGQFKTGLFALESPENSGRRARNTSSKISLVKYHFKQTEDSSSAKDVPLQNSPNKSDFSKQSNKPWLRNTARKITEDITPSGADAAKVIRKSVDFTKQELQLPTKHRSVYDYGADIADEIDLMQSTSNESPEFTSNNTLQKNTKTDYIEMKMLEGKNNASEKIPSVGKETAIASAEAEVFVSEDYQEERRSPAAAELDLKCTPELEPIDSSQSKLILTNCMVKFSALYSPPGRKLTNNSHSPTIQPKLTPLLTGRGAQLLNIVRNKNKDCSPCATIHTPMPNPHPTVTNEESKGGLLMFSKRLPSPTASPSSSTLKRKSSCEGNDEASMERPSCKRKGVSFRDPSASLTKEYVKDSSKNFPKPKRRSSVNTDNNLETEKCSTVSFKHKSMMPFDKENAHSTNQAGGNSTSIRFNSTDRFDKDSDSEEAIEAALDFVVQKCPPEMVFQRYFSTKTAPGHFLAKFVSDLMSSDVKIKADVLEILSKNHSNDFLDYAVQENLSSVVCDRLSLISIIEYICAKSKLNENCRNSLLAQIPDIFRHSASDSERIQLLKPILTAVKLSETHILDAISLLLSASSSRNDCAASTLGSTVDSSSS